MHSNWGRVIEYARRTHSARRADLNMHARAVIAVQTDGYALNAAGSRDASEKQAASPH
jgi:hypothetical protein